MSEEKQNEIEQSQIFDAGSKVVATFPEVVKIEPCSSNECLNGHKFPVQVTLGPCPGCGSPILLVRMTNCPICNEPTKMFRMRTDHTHQGFGVAARCRNQVGQAETGTIEILRHAHEEVQARWNAETGRMA